ncbi:MAG: NAD(P)H-hydrate epimerase [Fidelibacterota bacterium]
MDEPFPPALSVREMAEVDRKMIEDFHISLDQMMELAGRNLADLVERLLIDRRIAISQANILVCAGPGHNGGGGLTAARHLHNRGAGITVILTAQEEHLKLTTRMRLETLIRMEVTVMRPGNGEPKHFASTDLIVDALLGYNAKGEPRGRVADLMQKIIRSGNKHLLALDIPSGFRPEDSRFSNLHLTPEATLTLALPKHGMENQHLWQKFGHLFLADIGVPPELYRTMNLQVPPLFADGPVRLLSR